MELSETLAVPSDMKLIVSFTEPYLKVINISWLIISKETQENNDEITAKVLIAYRILDIIVTV